MKKYISLYVLSLLAFSCDPKYKDLQSIRQDIPDCPTEVFNSIQRHVISPEEALKRAACLEHPETITAIIANYPVSNHAKKLAFHAAVDNNSLQSCQVLFDCIEQGFDLDQPLYGPGNHDYFLTRAVLYNCSNVVTFLLDHGADVHINHDDALIDASRRGYFEITKILLEHGANVHANNEKVLAQCCSSFDRQSAHAIINLLIAAGARLENIHDSFWQSHVKNLLAENDREENRFPDRGHWELG
jgi:hypothetical protein